MIRAEGEPHATDHIGSAVSGGRRYYPYGDEIGTSADEKTKFATYFRDSTNLDYANQRYYAHQYGRFTSPDPFLGSADPSRPQSWNRYGYVEGDPVGLNDPNGLNLGATVCGAPHADGNGCGDGGGFFGAIGGFFSSIGSAIGDAFGFGSGSGTYAPDIRGYDTGSGFRVDDSRFNNHSSVTVTDTYGSTDYVTVAVGLTTPALVSATASVTIDSALQPYLGISFGVGTPGASVSVEEGRLESPNRTTPGDLSGHLSGWGYNLTAGAGGVAGLNYAVTPGSAPSLSTLTGIGTPQAGAAVGYTHQVPTNYTEPPPYCTFGNQICTN